MSKRIITIHDDGSVTADGHGFLSAAEIQSLKSFLARFEAFATRLEDVNMDEAKRGADNVIESLKDQIGRENVIEVDDALKDSFERGKNKKPFGDALPEEESASIRQDMISHADVCDQDSYMLEERKKDLFDRIGSDPEAFQRVMKIFDELDQDSEIKKGEVSDKDVLLCGEPELKDISVEDRKSLEEQAGELSSRIKSALDSLKNTSNPEEN